MTTGTESRAALAQVRAQAVELHRQKKLDEALRAYALYLSQAPGDGGIWTNLGALFRVQGRHDLALAAQERAHALEPENLGVINNYANILNDIGQNARALTLREELVRREPHVPNHKAMVGKSMRTLGLHAAAIPRLAAWADAHPEEPELRIQLALTQLAAGDYARGFRNYEARWLTGELTPRRMTTPKWDGGDLTGKRILVLPEQGFGDALTFARFLPVLRRFNPARVLLVCEKPLLRVMEGVEGADWIGMQPPPEEPYDVWTNMMDLPPLHFDTGAPVPPPTRLSVPDDSRARARALVAPFRDRFRVGVVWCGSVTYRANAFRSFSHTLFHRLLDVPGLQMFSLYKGPELAAFQADGSAAFIVDTASTDRDFADCAATMQEMDLVITSCTATCHLAGSLGVPTWTLLHWDAFWLWQIAQDDTPWYPSMRLIRQEKPRDWAGVFDRVKADLTNAIATKGGARR